MAYLIKKARIIDPKAGIDIIDDLFISPNTLEIAPSVLPNNYSLFDGQGLIVAPGFIDLHVHFREPGFNYKEDISSGIRASLAGGVTSALVMPNTKPAIDSASRISYQKFRARRMGFDLMVAAAGTKNLRGLELTDVYELKKAGAHAITDDGLPIAHDNHVQDIMKACRRHNLVFMQHAEDFTLSAHAPIHDGSFSKYFNIPGQVALAESAMIKRDLAFAESIGARYHVLHLSTKESLDLIRKAKRKKLRVSCEVTPHHLLLCEKALWRDSSNKKMNPPLRTAHDCDALIAALNDGSIDAVASDHAPHARFEKKEGLFKAPFGVVGLETSMRVLLSLVKEERITLVRALELMSVGPAKILEEEERIGTFIGQAASKNIVILDPHAHRVIGPHDFKGRSYNSAFMGMRLWGKIRATFLNGNLVYES
jgi:dihydroorotase